MSVDDQPRPGTAAARRARGRSVTVPPERRRARREATPDSSDGHDGERVGLAIDVDEAPVDPGTPPHGTPAARDETTAFLLQSLRDLEREHAAGDLDDEDYRALKDDYTSRAAVALRAEERGKAPPVPRKTARSPLQWVLIVAGVVGFAVLSGVFVAQASGQRQTGEGVTGDVVRTPTQEATECIQLSVQFQSGEADPQDALDCYRAVLDEAPDNAVAHTYYGWTLFLTAQKYAAALPQDELADLYIEAISQVEAGAAADPDYPDARAFLVVLAARTGDYEQAAAHLVEFDALNAPADMAALVDNVRDDIDAGLADADADAGAADGSDGSEGSGGADGSTTSTTAPG